MDLSIMGFHDEQKRLKLSQCSMHKTDCNRALADGRRDTLYATCTHVTYGEHAWKAAFKQLRGSFEWPCRADLAWNK